jgi:hypothetical protein
MTKQRTGSRSIIGPPNSSAGDESLRAGLSNPPSNGIALYRDGRTGTSLYNWRLTTGSLYLPNVPSLGIDQSFSVVSSRW